MKILITGSSGFIGSHVIDELLKKKDHEVIGYDLWFNKEDLEHQLMRDDFKFIKGSILEEDKLKRIIRNDVNVIVHLAAILGTSETIEKYSPLEVVRVNIIGILKILELARKHDNIERVIIPSTPDVPWFNPYKITKIAMERFALMYHLYYGVNTVILKLTNVYGPRERWLDGNYNAPYSYQKVVPTFIVNALMDKPLPIYGDGTQRASYIFVKDVANAFIKAMYSNKAIGRVIPIGSINTLSVNELADLIIEMCNSNSHKVYLPMRKGEVPVDISIDPNPARLYLGFKPRINIREGLSYAIPYYRHKLTLIGKPHK